MARDFVCAGGGNGAVEAIVGDDAGCAGKNRELVLFAAVSASDAAKPLLELLLLAVAALPPR